VLLVGVAGLAALAATGTRVDRLSRELTPAVEANDHLLQAMVDAQTGLRGYALTGEEDFLEPYRRGVLEVGEPLQELRRLVREPAGAELVAGQERAARDWLDRHASPDAATAGPQQLRAGKDAFDEFRDSNAALERWLTDSREELRAQTRALRSGGPVALAVLTLAAAVSASVAGVRTVLWVSRPTAGLRQVVDRLRLGQHHVRADVQAGPQEVRGLAVSVNTLADESDRLRALEAETARLRRASAAAARAVREQLDREAAMVATAGALEAALGVTDVRVAAVVDDTPEATELQRLAAAGEVGCTRMDGVTRVCAPVVGAAGLLAGITLEAAGDRWFSTAELALVQSVATDLGRALEHVNLYEQQLELVERLRDLDRQKTEFLSTVSHELRTPLTSIGGYTELIRDGDAGPVTPAMSAMLDVIERNTVRLRALIEDLLTLSRIESGTFRTTQAELDVAALVRGVEPTVRPQAEQAGLRLELDDVPTGLTVVGDELQLERVLLNLLTNAVKFTPAGGRVRLTVRARDGEVLLRCSDSGIGIPAAEQERLFSRFFRASNATDRAIPGTGLGLVIVRGIVERHGGRLTVESEEEAGTTVTVWLPLAAEGTAEAPAAFSPSVPPLAH
jgi:signal transduction histidine kinase